MAILFSHFICDCIITGNIDSSAHLLWLETKLGIVPPVTRTKFMRWFCSEFRYVTGNESVTYLADMVVAYFTELWYGQEKPFLYNERQMQHLQLTSPQSQANR